jgi:predicted SAM-dependent methyltransferase
MSKGFKKYFQWTKRNLRFLKRKLISPKWPKNEKGMVWLHIGCGRKDYPGFINVDGQPYPNVHIIKDNISNMYQFSSNSVDMVYMCHILEHFKKHELALVMKEMHRILKLGGILRLSVPDFDKLLAVYEASGKDLNSIRLQLMGGQENRFNFHYTVFTKRTMTEMLNQMGFKEVQEWAPLKLEDFKVKDKSMRKLKVGGQEIPISLNLWAIKK